MTIDHDITSPGPGDDMHRWARELFPICRSITGNGVRDTLEYLQGLMPDLTVHEVPSGARAFDWTVPDEWNIRDGFVADSSGERVIDFQDSNLHVMGYSEPVDLELTLDELDPHLFSIPDQPDAIPYVTSYYQRRWGFCLSQERRDALKPGAYRAVIDSTLEPGSLTYGELIMPGAQEKEILLSTYVCHPSMANNELSGPVVTAALARWIASQKNRRYTYRLIFIPETIGAIVYLSRNLDVLKKNMVAGYVVTCVGDDRTYSLMPSRLGNTLADRVARRVLDDHAPEYTEYSFLDRGSDERQFCSPGIDLPVASIMRSKYGTYPEYHTSLDDLSLISPAGLTGSFDTLRACLITLEGHHTYRATNLCEPQLGRHGLYPTISRRRELSEIKDVRDTMHILAYADGDHDILALAERLDIDIENCRRLVDRLLEVGLLERIE